jgi:hypothetical protein
LHRRSRQAFERVEVRVIAQAPPEPRIRSLGARSAWVVRIESRRGEFTSAIRDGAR